MKQLNCRNCGAPHNGKCDYCGTNYSQSVASKGINKKPLDKKLQLAVVIGLIIFPAAGLFLRKYPSFK